MRLDPENGFRRNSAALLITKASPRQHSEQILPVRDFENISHAIFGFPTTASEYVSLLMLR